MNERYCIHRSDVQEDAGNGLWVEAIPLPFYGIRKRCECGRKFWRESDYRRHWRYENTMLLYEERYGANVQ